MKKKNVKDCCRFCEKKSTLSPRFYLIQLVDNILVYNQKEIFLKSFNLNSMKMCNRHLKEVQKPLKQELKKSLMKERPILKELPPRKVRKLVEEKKLQSTMELMENNSKMIVNQLEFYSKFGKQCSKCQGFMKFNLLSLQSVGATFTCNLTCVNCQFQEKFQNGKIENNESLLDKELIASWLLFGGEVSDYIGFFKSININTLCSKTVGQQMEKFFVISNEEAKNSMDSIKKQMLENDTPISFEGDAQWSRPQRYGSRANACAFTAIDSVTKCVFEQEIILKEDISISHSKTNVEYFFKDSKNKEIKDAEKISRNLTLERMKKDFPKIGTAISDGCKSFHCSIKEILGTDVQLQLDVWHTLKGLPSKWESFKVKNDNLKCGSCGFIETSCSKRKCVKCKGNLLKNYNFPNLSNWNYGIIRNHILYWIEQSAKENFNSEQLLEKILTLGEYVEKKVGCLLFQNEKLSLKLFLTENLEEYLPYLTKNMSTSNSESFNSISNIYVRKGKNFGYDQFNGRKKLSIIHWNSLKKGILEEEWKLKLISKFLKSSQ
jgi:hypothetical protein